MADEKARKPVEPEDHSIAEWAGGLMGQARDIIKRRRNDVDEQVEGKSKTRKYD